MLAGLFRCATVLLSEIAQQSDLRQIGPEIVMNVFRDAGAFLMKSRLLLELLEAAVQTAERDISNNRRDSSGKNSHRANAKPPPLPEEASDRNPDSGGRTPFSLVSGSGNLEMIIPRTQAREWHAAGRGFHPRVIQTFDAITEEYGLGPDERRRGKFNLQPAMIRRKFQRRLSSGQINGSRANHVGCRQCATIP